MKHGLYNTPEYKSWDGMVDRCCNPKSKDYPNYGARGIGICSEWRHSPAAFIRDMGKKPSPSHSIERKNNNLSYSKDNCVWATSKEQALNRRSTFLIAYKDEIKPLSVWCEILQLNYFTVHRRIKYLNWPIEKAFINAGFSHSRRPT